MVEIGILYPNLPDGRFDFDHYRSRHMPRSITLLSTHPGFHAVSVGAASAGPSQARR